MNAAILEWYNEYVTGPESFKRVIKDKLEHTKVVGTCWIWPGPYGMNQYGSMMIGGIRTQATHLIIELQTKRPIPEGKEVCHICDNPPCINPDHLFIGTHKENLFDAASKGRRLYKLSDEKAKEIRALYAKGGESERSLAKKYGVARTTISLLLKGRTW